MTPERAVRPIHVERTADPAALCWVPHHPLLDSATNGRRQIPEQSPFGQLVRDGSITDITIRDGTVLVAVADPNSWPEIAPRAQDALLRELDRLDALDQSDTHWLVQVIDAADRPPSIADVQQIVDRAADSVFASHGGAMIVASVDGDSVRLRTEGACTGCPQSDDTLIGLIRPAVKAAHPGIVEVTLDESRGGLADSPPKQNVRFSTRLRRFGGGSCH